MKVVEGGCGRWLEKVGRWFNIFFGEIFFFEKFTDLIFSLGSCCIPAEFLHEELRRQPHLARGTENNFEANFNANLANFKGDGIFIFALFLIKILC